MSKLYEKFLEVKKRNPDKIYLFKSGIFYIALNEDAEKMSNIFDFKITNLNDEVTKCGFPEKKLEHYSDLLRQNHVDFEVVDLKYSKIENYSDYLNNIKFKNIINTLLELDLDNISFKESYNILEKLCNEAKSINDLK